MITSLTTVVENTIEERVAYLLANPNLGSEIIGYLRGRPIQSNCNGTTLWILGKEPNLQHNPAYSSDFIPAKGRDRPGYMHLSGMKRFLSEECTVVDNLEDAVNGIVGFWMVGELKSEEQGKDYLLNFAILLHTAVYLGNKKGETLFHQSSRGEPYGTTPLKEELARLQGKYTIDSPNNNYRQRIEFVFYKIR